MLAKRQSKPVSGQGRILEASCAAGLVDAHPTQGPGRLIIQSHQEAPTPAGTGAHPLACRPLVGVQVAFGEKALQSQVKAAGGAWDPAFRLWKLPRRAARRLGHSDRVRVLKE